MPLWTLGLVFVLTGIVLSGSGLRMLAGDWEWAQAITTTGRVIVTEWQREDKQNLLRVSYGYQDERGTIYHNMGTLARKLGRLNLEPGANLVVLYKPEDHSQSRLQVELGAGEWKFLLAIGLAELIAGSSLLVISLKRFLVRRAPTEPSCGPG